MSGKVIVITSGKGGVGKTTITANVGVALAQLGRNIVAVDADIGLRNLDVIMGLENRIVYDLVNVVEKVCEPQQALIRDKKLKNLFLLPAAQTRDKDSVSPEQMIGLLNTLREDFDYILIDSPAGIERGFKNAIVGADLAVVVTTPEVAAIRDADRVIGLLESSGKRDPQLIINRIRPDMVRKGDMMEVDDILDILAIKLIGLIPEDPEMVVHTNRGEPIALSPKAKSAEAFKDIARRLDGEDIPIVPPEEKEGFLKNLLKMLGG
ncbi:MAG: septum site-determining protein MinD [bacterium]